MNSARSDHRAELVRLTKTAVQAAKSGQWDIVIQCYRDRGILLDAMQSVVDQGEELLRLDRQVRDHVQITQTLLTSLISEATATRHRLQGLRQRVSMPTLASESMSMKA